MTARQSYYRPQGGWVPGSGSGANLAVQSMREILGATTLSAPLGVYVPWGKRKGGIVWETLSSGADLILYPVTDRQLTGATLEAFGNEPPWIGVLAPSPTEAGAADAVFNGTRYDLVETQGVYRVEDERPAPAIEFLYWGKLHDDVGGGRNSMEVAARRLGGRLVFPMEGQDPGRERPPFPFQFVLNQQLAMAESGASQAGMGVVALAASDAGADCPPGRKWALIGTGAVLGALGIMGVASWRYERQGRRR